MRDLTLTSTHLQIMALHGGRFENYYHRDRVTHIVCSNLTDAKIKSFAKERCGYRAWALNGFIQRKRGFKTSSAASTPMVRSNSLSKAVGSHQLGTEGRSSYTLSCESHVQLPC